MNHNSLEYRPRYHRKTPTGAAAVTCTCGLNLIAPAKEAWRIFEQHRTLAGLPHGFPQRLRLLFGLPG